MQINNTLEFYISVFEKKNLFKLFPNLKEELHLQYNEIVDNLDKQDINIDMLQGFSQTINTGIKDDYYTVSWSISKIDYIISKNSLSSNYLHLKNIFSDDMNLNSQKSVHYLNVNIENFKPIYVTYYLPIESFIVVDGNHRVKELKKRNIFKTKGYVLSPCCNIETMNDFSFSLYKFHHNLVSLHRLCKVPYLWSFKANKSLQKNTFYGDNEEFKYLLYKKIVLLFS